MFAAVWRYQAPSEKTEDFAKLYGAGGAWVKLFTRSDQYIGTDLLCGDDGDFIVIDRWTSEEGYERFMTENRAVYNALDDEMRPTRVSEALLGFYSV